MALAEALVLVSWWKPLLFVAPFIPWAWVISRVYDKDAARWYFKREAWNLGHIAAGTLAAAIMLAIPLPAFATMPIGAVVLIIDLLAYVMLRNGNDNVPERSVWTASTVFAAIGQGAKPKEKTVKSKKVRGITLVFKGPKGIVQPPEDPESPAYEIRVAAEELWRTTTDQRGSMLELAPHPQKKGGYLAVITVDSVRKPIGEMAAEQALNVIDFFKHVAGVDVQDRRRRLKGEFEVGPSTTSLVEVGLTTAGTTAGPQLSMLIEPEKRVAIPIDRLGFTDRQLESVKKLVGERGGVVLVSALPRGGRTSLLYALIRGHDAYTSNIQTVERDPQAMIEGVTTSDWDPQDPDEEYSNLVRSVLRRDPDAVGISEFDEATAREVSKADLERIRAYLTVPESDEFEAISRYVKAVGDGKAAAKGLRGVVAVRLMRRLCENCKVAYTPTPDMLRKLGLSSDTKQLYRKGGTVLVKEKETECPVCNTEGYFGVIGAYGVLHFDNEARRLIAAGDMQGLRGLLRQQRQITIQNAALAHIASGHTAIEEVQRALQSGKRRSSSSQKKPSNPQPAAAES